MDNGKYRKGEGCVAVHIVGANGSTGIWEECVDVHGGGTMRSRGEGNDVLMS